MTYDWPLGGETTYCNEDGAGTLFALAVTCVWLGMRQGSFRVRSA